MRLKTLPQEPLIAVGPPSWNSSKNSGPIPLNEILYWAARRALLVDPEGVEIGLEWMGLCITFGRSSASLIAKEKILSLFLLKKEVVWFYEKRTSFASFEKEERGFIGSSML